MITINNISRHFEAIKAVDDVSFTIREGELFGLIGPDGAGKTTLLRMINSLIIPTSGSISLWGLDPVKDYRTIRTIIGYMPGKFSLYQDLSVEENLDFFATVFGTTIQENYHLIKDIYSQIEPFKKRKAGQLSGGMKQKLALSCALIHKPQLLILDEPTTGVDAVSRREFWEMLKRLKESNITIIVSTPYMDEAILCDRVALMQKGKIMQIDTPENIVKDFSRQLFAIKTTYRYQTIQLLRQWEHTHSVFAFGESLHYTDKRENTNPQQINEWLISQNIPPIDVSIEQPSIEDRFMELMGPIDQTA
jgi:ABC-type multidrug transport system ATPase subunit